ncbi:MAG: RNA ligase family protein [Oscillospiraceae bacterium]|nr:RNA ligase family protein [Oscillospiraceae bacterium]
MSDLFFDRAATPMLIGASGEPFDDPDCIFELKLDGERCLAYLDRDTMELRNKRGNRLSPKFPELAPLSRQVKRRCILDGELTVFKEGKPAFAEVQRRVLLGGGLRAQLAAEKLPACYTVFDILYCDARQTTELPLLERRALLRSVVRESERFAVSRCADGQGIAFFELAKAQALEGVVAKRKDSLYRMGKRTDDWVKIKNLLDDDFVVCGYIPADHSMNSLILGQYDAAGQMIFRGRVSAGAAGAAFQKIRRLPPAGCPFETIPRGSDGAVWLPPALVCAVQFMQLNKAGGLRQPVFKALRTDKTPEECLCRR